MVQDVAWNIHWYELAIALRQHWHTFLILQVPADGLMLRYQGVDWEWLVGVVRPVVDEATTHVGHAIRPARYGNTVHGTGPPWWFDMIWHGVDKAEHLTAVEDSLFGLIDASRLQPGIRSIASNNLSSSKLLDALEAGDGVQRNEMVDDEVGCRSPARTFLVC